MQPPSDSPTQDRQPAAPLRDRRQAPAGVLPPARGVPLPPDRLSVIPAPLE